ncbi:MAG: cell envelope integrity protein CreD [Nitrosopumilus sp.]|nr:cell envelope integrity protein CreD [Nitrosopumilus sp.]
MEEKNQSLFDRFNNWLRESVMIKLVSIAILVLLLLIPAAWVQSIMEERQMRVEEAFREVSGKWSDAQSVTGPVLVLPYIKTYSINSRQPGGDVITEIKTVTERAYFLPENLKINAELDPLILNRGIFDVVVYNSRIAMNGNFSKPNLDALDIDTAQVKWNEAYLMFGLTDLRGIGETPVLKFNEKVYTSEPHTEEFRTNEYYNVFNRSIASKIDINQEADNFSFTMNYALKGSGKLYFLPMGKSTSVDLSGDWGNPSFDGFYLPETRDVTNESFAATYNVLNFNRPFPQQWINSPPAIHETAFGVNLIMPVDQYQKSIRTAKYGVLIILLTFVSLFLIELICKIRIHPFQYVLIGAALIVYYTLLLSISEQIGFNNSNLIATIDTVALISFYSISFTGKKNISALLSFLLLIFYGYIFIITQQQDYALLLGSIGLFIIIAVLMYVSRKINWYSDHEIKPAL